MSAMEKVEVENQIRLYKMVRWLNKWIEPAYAKFPLLYSCTLAPAWSPAEWVISFTGFT